LGGAADGGFWHGVGITSGNDEHVAADRRPIRFVVRGSDVYP
jgi:hypothetical protein